MRAHAIPAILLFAGLGAPARAQEPRSFRGTVRDSASGQPILGAVLLLRDSADNVVMRTISGDRGQYLLPAPGGARRLRLLRIGFRPREIALPETPAGMAQLDLAMVQIPTLLETLRTVASTRCRARPDAAAAFGALDQARAGLLATVVARETNPASMTLMVFERVMAGISDSVDRQKVRTVSDARATVSFNAAHTARDFVRDGFRRDSAGRETFYGPDAEVLLDDGFASGYCFSIASVNAARRNQVGLAFAPATRRGDRVDIEGTLWMDTVSRSLVDVEFRYLGLDDVTEALKPGGRVSFRGMENGVVLIDEWSLRIIGAADTTVDEKTGQSVRRGLLIREVGGALARARWPDGHEWTAPLGKVRLAVVDHRGEPAAGRAIGLDSTDYRAVTDSAGMTEIEHLVPGPYQLIMADPRLAALGVTLRTRLAFRSTRDSTIQLRLEAPAAEDFLADLCRTDDASGKGPWLFGRITTTDGQGVNGARWRLAKASDGVWRAVADGGRTGPSGVFHHCRKLAIGDAIQIRAWREGETPVVMTHRVTEQATIVPIQLQATLGSGGRGAPSSRAVREIGGTVMDSATRQPVTGARVTLAGTPHGAFTDSAGRFTMPGVRVGEYVAEVRTWALDSLGVIGHSPLVLGDSQAPVTLYVPTKSQVAATLCAAEPGSGPLAAGAASVVVGRAEMTGDTLPPFGLRVVAEWADQQSRESRWVETRTDARGAFRLCGVPRGKELAVRAATEGVTGKSVSVRVPPEDGVAIVELSLGRVVALPSVTTTERVTIPSFEANRKLGVGRFLTRDELAKHENQQLVDVLVQVPGLGAMHGRGNHGWVVSSHVTPRLTAKARGEQCGTAANPCSVSVQALADQGVYCPSDAEKRAGVVCGCYAQIYLDRQLMNPGRPTEPWDINTIPTQEIEAVEYYPSPAQTPTEYSRSDAACGVLVLWTRRQR